MHGAPDCREAAATAVRSPLAEHVDIGQMVTRIDYRGFWDVPREFVTRHNGLTFFFDCPFNSQLDEFPDEYCVYLMPELTEHELQGSWRDLPAMSKRSLGTVPLDQVRFDSTCRRTIETGVLDRLMMSRR